MILIIIYQSTARGHARGRHKSTFSSDFKLREISALHVAMYKFAQPFLSLFCQSKSLETYSAVVKMMGLAVTLNLISGFITYYTCQLTLLSFPIFICKIRIRPTTLDYMRQCMLI